MSLVQKLREQLVDILEWRAVDKGLIPVVCLPFIYSFYLLWGYIALSRADRDRLIHVRIVESMLSVLWVLMAGAGLLVLLGLWLRKRWPDLTAYQYLTVFYFTFAMVFCGYLTGSTSFAAGIVLLGAPLFGFILLDHRPVLVGFALAFVVLSLATFASAVGYIPYAPVMVVPVDAPSRLFWACSIYLMAVPNMLIILPLADRVLTWWREREAMIRRLSRTDMLTGIHNRRGILELLDKETARTDRHGPPLAVVLLDLDFFKKVNDTWGHPTGDRVLQQAAKVLRGTIRQCDAVGRYGGEEFMLLLPDTTRDGALALVERCRERLANVAISADNGEVFTISGSFGLASNEDRFGLSSDALIKAADAALYRAKDRGRNRVELARFD